MKSTTIACLLIIIVSSLNLLPANEIDDFRFALGLYSDQNYRLARSELEKFIRQYPESPFLNNARFLLANIHLNDGSYEQALEIFSELHAEGADPEIRPEIILGLGQSYFFTDDHAKARSFLTSFIEDFKTHRLLWKARFFLGRIEYRNENYEKSLTHLTEAKQLNPDWPVLIAHLNTLLQLSMQEEAEKSIATHIEDDVRNEFVYQMIVIYLNRQLKEQEYRTVTTFARNYIPRKSQYYDDYLLVLSEAKIEQGQYSEALALLEDMETETERSSYLTALSYLRTGEEDQAEALFTNLSENARNIEIRSNSFFYLAGLKGRRDISVTNDMLEQFIRGNPEHPFAPAAKYQLGFNHFNADKYGDAINYLTKARTAELDDELDEKALYLKAESYFQLQHTDRAIQKFETYFNTFPDGRFIDEVLFKRGLHYFRNDDYPQAFVSFDRIINDYPDSDRASMASFYQAEIFTTRNQYELAFSKYQNALDDFEDKGLIWLRIAQVNFNLGNYDQVLQDLTNVPDIEAFQFEKRTIRGNAYFAKRDYLNALRNFEEAQAVAATAESREDAILRQARTLYNLNEYREALRLYRRLIDMNPEERYIMMAAAVAFSAEDYGAAAGLYNLYLQKYPEGRDFYRAKLHLADSYYNSQEFEKAAAEYQKLIQPDMERSILMNSLNGLRWSANQSEEVDYETLLLDAIKPDAPTDFRIMLQDRLVRYYFDRERWEDVITTAGNIIELAPDDYNTYEIELMMARSQTRLELYRLAENTYQRLYDRHPDAEVLFHWAETNILQQDSVAALGKVRRAADKTDESTVWLQLLRLGIALNDELFSEDYENYLAFAQNAEREQAQLLKVKWKLQRDEFAEADSLINELLNSEYESIKARAQYYKGVRLYRSGAVEESIPELLRVRYLYPRIEDVRIEAEHLACYAYLEIDDRDSALRLFDSIKNSLSEQDRKELEQELGLEG